MKASKFLKAAGVTTAFVAIVAAGMVTSSRHVKAHDDDDEGNESRIQRGFEIAPVPLDLVGKNRHLVGLGSYIVNAVADCNGCHSAGPPTEFAMGGNPYLRSPFFTGKEVINPATYLGGGRDFGPIGSAAHVISRNLTPTRPEG